jgi:hypothetical protein
VRQVNAHHIAAAREGRIYGKSVKGVMTVKQNLFLGR